MPRRASELSLPHCPVATKSGQDISPSMRPTEDSTKLPGNLAVRVTLP